MKHFLLTVMILFTMCRLPRAAAQDGDDTRPPITSQTAGQVIELAQAEETMSTSTSARLDGTLAIHNNQMAISTGGTVRLYSLPDLTLLHDLGHGGRVQFSPDGAFLTYRNSEYGLTLWDTNTQSVYAVIEDTDIIYWQFSPDGRLILRRRGAIQVYTLDPFVEIASLPAEWETWDEAIAPDGQWLAHNNLPTSSIEWCDIASQTVFEFDPGGNAIVLLSSPDSQTLAALVGPADEGGKSVIRLWDVATHAEIATLPLPQNYIWTRPPSPDQRFIKFSADSTTLAAALVLLDEETGTSTNSTAIRLWDVAALSEPVTLYGSDLLGPPLSLEISPDGRWVMLENVSRAASVYTVWDTTTQTQSAALGGTFAINERAFSPDGHLMAFDYYEFEDSDEFHHVVGLFDMSTGTLAQMLHHESPVTTVIFTSDASLLFTLTENGTGHVWGVGESEPSIVAENRAKYKGVSVDLGIIPDSTLSGEIIPPVGRWDESIGGFWDILPEHISIRINQDDHTICWINVFSAEDYETMYPGTMEALSDGLQNNSPDYCAHQDLWPINASRVLFGQERYFPLADGQTWRYLADYAQGVFPIYNPIAYQTLGLVNNEQYYVRVECGVSAWFLGDSYDAASRALGLDWDEWSEQTAEWQTFIDNVGDYYHAVDQQLEGTANSGFQPALDTLDALVASIQVSDAPLGGNLPGCNFDSLVARHNHARIVGDRRQFYSAPSFDNPIHGELPEGTVIDLESGPVCNDDTLWWHAGYPGEKATGWIPEARDGDPWLEPVE